jgi:hypothetical protein
MDKPWAVLSRAPYSKPSRWIEVGRFETPEEAAADIEDRRAALAKYRLPAQLAAVQLAPAAVVA